MGLGPSLSWGPMETEFVGKSGTSDYDLVDVGLHTHLGTNVDRLATHPLTISLSYYGLLA